MANAPSLAAALERLYAAAPADFLTLRGELARSLRAAHRPDDARALAKRRKPTHVAHLLNQLARRHADDVAELVDIGRALGRAQRATLRGGANADLRATMERQRTALRHLVRTASELGGSLDLNVSTHALSEAFQCALGDPACAAALEAGLLETAPTSTAGPTTDNPFAASPETEEPALPPRRGVRAGARVVRKKDKRLVEVSKAEKASAKAEREAAAAAKEAKAAQARAAKAAQARAAKEAKEAKVRAAATARRRAMARAKLGRAQAVLTKLVARQRALARDIAKAEQQVATLRRHAA